MSATVINGPTKWKAKQGYNGHADDWRDDLILTATKNPKPLLANALTALRKAPEWLGVLAYDEFALVTMLMKAPPWSRHQHNNWTRTQWTDRDDALTADWLQHNGINVSVQIAATAADTVAKDHSIRLRII